MPHHYYSTSAAVSNNSCSMRPIPIVLSDSDGGVEEKKEEETNAYPPDAAKKIEALHRPRGSSSENSAPFDEEQDGFQTQFQNIATSVFGSCGQALSCLVPSGELHCRWPSAADPTPPRFTPPAPLSIADELQKLAVKEGRIFGGGMRRADIPRFLGEEAVYSWDDDNISAISQHTLEDMARHGIKYPVRRRPSSESCVSSNGSDTLPPRVAACSTSTRSSREHRKQRLTRDHRKDRSRLENDSEILHSKDSENI